MTLVKIRAVGNGTTTFSSSASASYNVVTLAKPEIKLATETYSIVGTYTCQVQVTDNINGITITTGDIVVNVVYAPITLVDESGTTKQVIYSCNI